MIAVMMLEKLVQFFNSTTYCSNCWTLVLVHNPTDSSQPTKKVIYQHGCELNSMYMCKLHKSPIQVCMASN